MGGVRKWRGEAFGAKGGLEGRALEELEERLRQEGRGGLVARDGDHRDLWCISSAKDQRRGLQ
jgi:hypothetical protein